ncbi:hypothetical protein Ciccas_012357 [Cichlidogyrus casuarinus]|uniref:Alpha-carbonic anhydrase domain-containing protein n=1 Tax=Cichlidogyrus casuarinus TaxID=1844966 RepID=A0ABD2PPC0_9PLAT
MATINLLSFTFIGAARVQVAVSILYEEMHIVNYKAKFNSVADAVSSNEGDALAVLGIVFEESDDAESSDLVTELLEGRVVEEGNGTMEPVDLPKILRWFSDYTHL